MAFSPVGHGAAPPVGSVTLDGWPARPHLLFLSIFRKTIKIKNEISFFVNCTNGLSEEHP